MFCELCLMCVFDFGNSIEIRVKLRFMEFCGF